MKKLVISILSLYAVITTVAYTLLCSVFFELGDVFGEEESFDIYRTMIYNQH